jgi:hypothetical protein
MLLRISHAQYDGICFPFIIQTLLDVYYQRKPAFYPLFSGYLAHVQSQRPRSARYWRDLLEGSHVTYLTQESYVDQTLAFVPKLIRAECSIPTPSLPANLTAATLVSAAWALVLCSATGKEDIVFGQLVAGRNASIPGVQEIIGPCVNFVPVRTQIHPDQLSHELLDATQHQMIMRRQADSMGLQDIVAGCTDWPTGTQFESTIQHVGSDRAPKFRLDEEYVHLRWLEQDKRFFPRIQVVSTSEDKELRLEVTGDRSRLSLTKANTLLGLFRTAVLYLSDNPMQPLRQWLNCKDATRSGE